MLPPFFIRIFVDIASQKWYNNLATQTLYYFYQ